MTNYKQNIDRKLQFINAISNCLSQVKAYNLPNVCSSEYGLKEGDTLEAYSSKKTYITSRIQHKNLDELILLGKKILESYYEIELENLILLESSSKIIDPQSLKNLHNTKEISSEYIGKYIQDCKKYIDIKEYEKAIAHARVLVEEVFIEILKQSNVDYDDTKGDLVKLFKKITKNTNLNKEIITEKLKNKELQDSFSQILSSLAGIVTATSHISNNMSARHGGIKEKPSENHATLIVNCAYTVCNFIFNSYTNFKKIIEN